MFMFLFLLISVLNRGTEALEEFIKWTSRYECVGVNTCKVQSTIPIQRCGSFSKLLYVGQIIPIRTITTSLDCSRIDLYLINVFMFIYNKKNNDKLFFQLAYLIRNNFGVSLSRDLIYVFIQKIMTECIVDI